MIPDSNTPIQVSDVAHMTTDELNTVRSRLNANSVKSAREEEVIEAIDIELRKVFGSVYF